MTLSINQLNIIPHGGTTEDKILLGILSS